MDRNSQVTVTLYKANGKRRMRPYPHEDRESAEAFASKWGRHYRAVVEVDGVIVQEVDPFALSAFFGMSS